MNEQELNREQLRQELKRKREPKVKSSIADYHFISSIGRGTWGEVGLYVKDGKRYAIKKINRHKLKRNRSVMDNLNKNEVEVLSALSKDPNCNEYVSCIYKYDTSDPDYYYIIMEYIDGIELFDYLTQSKPSELMRTNVTRLFVQLLKGLRYIHSKGVAHGDIKPENIMVYFDGGHEKLPEEINAKYIDFGFACGGNGFDLKCEQILGTMGGNYMHGTRGFFPPNKFDENKSYLENMKHADKWALGATLGILLPTVILGYPSFWWEVEAHRMFSDPYTAIIERNMESFAKEENYEGPNFENVEKDIKGKYAVHFKIIEGLMTRNVRDRMSLDTAIGLLEDHRGLFY
jgi:serine/threonine protein kinase